MHLAKNPCPRKEKSSLLHHGTAGFGPLTTQCILSTAFIISSLFLYVHAMCIIESFVVKSRQVLHLPVLPGGPGGPGSPGGPGKPSLPGGPGKGNPGEPFSPFSPLSPGTPGDPTLSGSGRPLDRVKCT